MFARQAMTTNTPPPRVCVLGAGIVGLSTARELRKRGYLVTVVSAELPKDTTSAGAGGFWEPFHCEPAELVERWAKETLVYYLGEHVAKGDPLVERQAVVQLNSGPREEPPSWTAEPLLRFRELSLDALAALGGTDDLYRWGGGGGAAPRTRLPPGWRAYPRAWLWHTVVVDSPRYLEALLSALRTDEKGVELRLGPAFRFATLQDAAAFAMGRDGGSCAALVNCSGLGSHGLCGDADVVAGRGGVAHFSRRRLPPPPGDSSSSSSSSISSSSSSLTGPPAWKTVVISETAPFGSGDKPAYVIPRGSVYVVGGSFWEIPLPLPPRNEGQGEGPVVDIDEVELARLRRNALALGALQDGGNNRSSKAPSLESALGPSRMLGTWVGMRPVRTRGVRVEVESSDGDMGIPVVHNYGHGGSGWTICVGTALSACDLVDQVLGTGTRQSRQQEQEQQAQRASWKSSSSGVLSRL